MVLPITQLDHRIQFVLGKMEECACQKCPDLREFASALGISGSYLRHLFKKEVGVPPNRYLKLIRLEKLRALLICHPIQIKQAIAASGLTDFSHTVRDYKALYGQTPSQTSTNPKKPSHLRRNRANFANE